MKLQVWSLYSLVLLTKIPILIREAVEVADGLSYNPAAAAVPIPHNPAVVVVAAVAIPHAYMVVVAVAIPHNPAAVVVESPYCIFSSMDKDRTSFPVRNMGVAVDPFFHASSFCASSSSPYGLSSSQFSSAFSLPLLLH